MNTKPTTASQIFESGIKFGELEQHFSAYNKAVISSFNTVKCNYHSIIRMEDTKEEITADMIIKLGYNIADLQSVIGGESQEKFRGYLEDIYQTLIQILQRITLEKKNTHPNG